MDMRTSLLLSSLLFPVALVAQGLASQAPAHGSVLEPISKAVGRLVSSLRLEGAALVVLRQNGEIHRSEHGAVGSDQVLPVASASKWFTVATILSLVDDGVLDLDAPVARYVQEFDRDDKDMVTLRQCLSCTAGFGVRLGGRMRGWGSDEFAAAAADAALRHGPGNGFRYGGVTFQVAALAAERATGKSWHKLFAEHIARPLGLDDTAFGARHPIGSEPGTAKLPWVAEGAVSTLEDYSRFMRCLLNNGRVGNKQVLSEASCKAMFRDSVPGHVEVHSDGFDADSVRYGLGTWLFALDGGAVRASNPGAGGFTPWIDVDLGLAGVFAVHNSRRRVLPRLLALQGTVRKVAHSPLVSGKDTSINLTYGGRDRRYYLHLPPQAAKAPSLPLVLMLHADGDSGEQVARTTGFTDVADREGFIVAFPDGTGPARHRRLTWNSGGLPVYAVDRDIDDVGFLREVIADIGRRTPVNVSRVFAVGHSNGGMMCHRLAREAGDLFAGIAVVGGAMNFTKVTSAMPLGVLIIHGSDDQHVLYHGGKPRAAKGRVGRRVDASVQDAVDYYIRRNALHGYPKSATDPFKSLVKVDTYGTGQDGNGSWAPVRVITLTGGGHAWPGAGEPLAKGGDRPFDYDATQNIWDFFSIVRRVPISASRKNRGTPAVPR